MDTHERLRQLLNERGWTEYRLAKNCGLSESTIANIYRRNTVPSIATLETICNGLGITMSQFFAEGDMVEITPELKELFDNWVNLTPEQKKAANQMLKAMNSDKWLMSINKRLKGFLFFYSQYCYSEHYLQLNVTIFAISIYNRMRRLQAAVRASLPHNRRREEVNLWR